MKKTHKPHACEDCCEIHGDSPAEWLAKWPTGAEWRKSEGAYLCDGCHEDRTDQSHDTPSWEDCDY